MAHKILPKPLTPDGNLLYARDGTCYQHKPGKRSRLIVDEKGHEHLQHYYISEGLIRLTPRRHVTRRAIKDDQILKGQRIDGRVKHGTHP